MVVRRYPRSHCFTWHVLAGAPFDGQLRLSPVSGGWTRIDVTATAWPERFIDCLSEMLHLSATDHVIDLVGLQAHLEPRDTHPRAVDAGDTRPT